MAGMMSRQQNARKVFRNENVLELWVVIIASAPFPESSSGHQKQVNTHTLEGANWPKSQFQIKFAAKPSTWTQIACCGLNWNEFSHQIMNIRFVSACANKNEIKTNETMTLLLIITAAATTKFVPSNVSQLTARAFAFLFYRFDWIWNVVSGAHGNR